MKATFFRLTCGLLIAALLTAAAGCGSSSGGNTAEPTAAQQEVTEAAITESMTAFEAQEETTSESVAATEAIDYQEAYRRFLLDYVAENGEDPERWFGFIYLDDDDIPELTICEGTYHVAGVEIYTCKNAQVEHIDTIGTMGEVMYVSNQSLLYYTYMGQGYESTGLYEYKDGKINCIWSAENDAGRMEDESQATYTVNDKTVTKDVYDEEYNKQIESRDFIRSPYPDDNNTYSLTKTSIRSCDQL